MLTFTGFVVGSIVLFLFFLAWYWFVHRNGVYNAAVAKNGDTLANLPGTDRMRPTASPRSPHNFAMTEFGTIGEEDATGSKQQQRPITDPHRLLPAPEQQRDSR